MSEPIRAIRCDHDGLKMAEVKDGHLILRTKHHGETHVKVVALGELVEEEEAPSQGPEKGSLPVVVFTPRGCK